MIGRRLFVLAMLSNCVLSLPLIAGQLENEDAKVMKCIVEALADVLSRPHPTPVSQECLDTLRTDDRLVSILRHRNFLKELQEIAVQGHRERAPLQGDAGTPDPVTLTPQTASDVADRSMVEAVGGPADRSVLSEKRRTGNGAGAEEEDESLGGEASQEATDAAEEVKGGSDKRPRGHILESMSMGRAEKSEEDEGENEKKRGTSKENSEENMTKDNKDAGSGEKSDAPRSKSKKKFEEVEVEEVDKKSAPFSHEPQEEKEDEETKRGSKEGVQRRAKEGKASPLKGKGVEREARRPGGREEVPHHSKEVSGEDEGKLSSDVQRSPEEKELQMIARRGPEERRGLEEEGSASRRSEEPEIESLAAIESELESVAQRLHDLRQG